MRILHTVQRYHPDSGGSEEVVRQISERLAAWGHEVTVATGASAQSRPAVIRGVRVESFDVAGSQVDGIRGEAQRFASFVRGAEVDVIMNYAAQIWSTDLVLPLLKDLRAKTVLVPCGYSQLRNPRFARYFEDLPGFLRGYDAVIYLSPNYIDTAFGASHGLTNGRVIPNAADLGEFARAVPGRFRAAHRIGGRPMMLNVSNHSALKNHRFFWNCARMLADLGVQPVQVASAYFPGPQKWLRECYAECRWRGLSGAGLVLEDLPRPQVADAYTDADVFVFGSRVECSPLVMFESFASRTLFVTTDCGNVSDYDGIACIVEDERGAAQVVRDYLAHPERYAARVEHGFDAVRTRLNWDQIAREYLSLYTELIRRS